MGVHHTAPVQKLPKSTADLPAPVRNLAKPFAVLPRQCKILRSAFLLKNKKI
jgi:hypothetical protein